MDGIIVYCLAHPRENRTYVGWTNDWARRLRQHRGEIKGGAAATRAVDDQSSWQPLFCVIGFKTKRHAQQLEWLLHRRVPRKRGESPVEWRWRRLREAMARERFTTDAPVTGDCPLETRVFSSDVQ